jgi:small subunit ribosomal protein S8
MSVTDPIADALTKIRNAYRAGHQEVIINRSKVVESIIKILADERYVNQFEIFLRDLEKGFERDKIKINLRYTNSGEPVMKGIERISTPGRRIYVKADNLPTVFNHIGSAIISTSTGVMTDRDAKKNHIGGEYLCKVW